MSTSQARPNSTIQAAKTLIPYVIIGTLFVCAVCAGVMLYVAWRLSQEFVI